MLTRKTQLSRITELERGLLSFHNNVESIEIILDDQVRKTLILQLVDSIRRIEYVEAISVREISTQRQDPNSTLFDPIRASLKYNSEGNYDEACWLVFLFTHFGKNEDTGWQLCKDIYSGYGSDSWTWKRISSEPNEFEAWYRKAYPMFLGDGVPRKYGNHRKYESLKPDAKRPIPKIFNSYINWIGATRSHFAKFAEARHFANESQIDLFEYLYKSMSAVLSFGRTAKFDYLTMLKKAGLLDIEPMKLYLGGSTGPIAGARLLFGENYTVGWTVDSFEERLNELASYLGLDLLGMQVLEDSLCNWQKNPRKYKYFRG